MGEEVAVGGDLAGAQGERTMTVIRLPSWSEILAPETPWGLILDSGGGGLWLLRGAAEEVPELDARIVAAAACRSSADLFSEWAAALEFPDYFAQNWDAFEECIGDLEWIERRACAVLIADADRLLADEPERVTTLLAILRSAAEDDLPERGRTLRIVFQSRFDERPELPDVLSEFGAASLS